MMAVWRVGAGLALAWFCCGFTGCAATLAMRQPDMKDLSVLQPGVPRGRVVAELGPPLTSYPSEEGGVDVFHFTQGYTRFQRTARALGHATGTVVTGGVWEIAGIPIETWYSGTDVKLEVFYDLHGRVAWVQVFEGADAFRGRILAEHVRLAGAGPPPSYSPAPPYSASPQYSASPPNTPTPATPVSGPPLPGSPVNGPPVTGPPVTGPPLTGPPLSGPPLHEASVATPVFDPQPPLGAPSGETSVLSGRGP